MDIDIIDVTESDLQAMSTIQVKLIRTAQQKKNDLQTQLNKNLEELQKLFIINRMETSSVFYCMQSDLYVEFDEKLDALVEQLQFNLNLKEPGNDGDLGGSGSDTSGYLVDYSLPYIERYIQVRDYYINSIPDPNERLTVYANDTVAQEYLATYYNTLYDYLAGLTDGY